MTKVILEIDKPHFTVKLYENLLRIDLKGSFKNEIEEALENKPILKETVGSILGIFVPLHINLGDIRSAGVDPTGKVRINLAHHRDIVIPFEGEDGKRLVDELNHLILRARRRKFELERLRRKRAKLKRKSRKVSPSSYATVPYYFPTEQVDNVGKLRSRKRKEK